MENTNRYLNIGNAHLIFRNFSGRETEYNAAGNRNFAVVINDGDQAQQLAEDGWNVKPMKQRDPDEPPRYYLSVTVRFDPIPPTIWTATADFKHRMSEDEVGTLDHADIEHCDVVIRPRVWTDKRGEDHIKAYLKTMYVTLEEDAFAANYTMPSKDDMPNSTLPF